MTGYTNDCLATVHHSQAAAAYMFAAGFSERFGELHGQNDDGWCTVWAVPVDLRLLPATEATNLFAEVRFSTTTRRHGRWDEANGSVVVRAPLVPVPVGGDGSRRAWALDFSAVPDDDYRTSIDETSFRPALLAALAPALRAEPFAITPSVPAGMNPKLGVYGFKKPGASAAAIAAVIFLLPPSKLPPIVELTASKGAELRVNKPIIDLALKGALTQQGLNAPPERKLVDAPLTFLERAEVQLRTGSVLAFGRVRTEIAAIDHSIDFELSLRAEADEGELRFRLVNSSVTSTSVLFDAAEFFSESAISAMVRDKVRAALKSASAASIDPQALVGDLSVAPFTVIADGRAEHRADGIGIPFDVRGPQQRASAPPYALGHRLSREVHASHGCRYGDAIAPRYLRRFPTPERAIAAGYDGCASCLPKLNNWDEGRVYLSVSGPDDGTVPKVVLRIAAGATRSGIALDPLEEQVELERTGRVRGIAVFQGVLKGIVPGEWDVDHRWGDHQHVQRVSIEAVQRNATGRVGTGLDYLRGEDRLVVSRIAP